LVGVSAIVVLALVAGAVVLVIASRQSKYPSHWDARVKPIADFDQRVRGLDFKHPVKVNFLTPKEYTKVSTGGDSPDDKPTAADKRDEANSVSFLRALGLVSGKLDLEAAGKDLSDTGSLAFYSPETKQVYVRGNVMTPGVRVTLAHELTHVLQDQHYDLTRLDKLGSDEAEAFRAVVEGDAVHTEDKYKSEVLTAAERKEYTKEEDKESKAATSTLKSKVPSILTTLFEAPYAFGGRLVTLLQVLGGNSQINMALKDPPSTGEQVFDAQVYLHRSAHPRKTVKLKQPTGAKRLDSGEFGSIEWYLTLSRQIDAHQALAAVDGWAGDHYVEYRTKDQKVCVDSGFQGSSAAETKQMFTAMQAFSLKVPSTAHMQGDIAVLTACDPGLHGKKADYSADDALVLPLVRTDVYTELRKEHDSETHAHCFAQGVVDRFSVDQLKGSGSYLESPAGAQILAEIRAGCG
jgi:hypothetical protein